MVHFRWHRTGPSEMFLPTAKPRVQVTVTPVQFDLLRRLSKLQKRSMSAVLSELLVTIEPVLERVAVVLEAAVRAQSSALEGLLTASESAQAEVEPLMAAALGQLDLLASAVGVEQRPEPWSPDLARASVARCAPPASPATDVSPRPSTGSRKTPLQLTGGSGTKTTVHKHSRSRSRVPAKRRKTAAKGRR